MASITFLAFLVGALRGCWLPSWPWLLAAKLALAACVAHHQLRQG